MENTEIIGRGMTSEIYSWEDGKVVKLFYEHFSQEAADYEAEISQQLNHYKINAPKFHGKVIHKCRIGLIYDRVYGEDLISLMSSDLFHMKSNLKNLVQEQCKIHSVECKTGLKSQKDRLSYMIELSKDTLGDFYHPLIQRLEKAENPYRLCHGDYHPGNVLLQEGEYISIDWMNAYAGDPLSDAVRSYIMMTSPFLPEEIPFPVRTAIQMTKPRIGAIYKKEYLSQASADEKDFRAWIPVMAAARLIEQIPGEKEWLMKMIKKELAR